MLIRIAAHMLIRDTTGILIRVIGFFLRYYFHIIFKKGYVYSFIVIKVTTSILINGRKMIMAIW